MLTKEELIDKINGIEWEDIEIKKAEYAVPKNSWDTVSAFANTMGGYLIFGVSQIEDKFKIAGVNNPKGLKEGLKGSIILSFPCKVGLFAEGAPAKPGGG